LELSRSATGEPEQPLLENISMMGGTVLLFITGAGRYAVDAMLQRR